VAKDAHYPEPARRGQASARGLGAGNPTRTGVTTMGKRVRPLNDDRVVRNAATLPAPSGPSSRRPSRASRRLRSDEPRIRLRFTGSRLPSSCAHGPLHRFRRP
jgi:hypothetical protein